MIFSNSLIIYPVNRKEIMTMNVIVISIHFPIIFRRFFLSFSFNWGDITNIHYCQKFSDGQKKVVKRDTYTYTSYV